MVDKNGLPNDLGMRSLKIRARSSSLALRLL
jgi:hypothetical protein